MITEPNIVILAVDDDELFLQCMKQHLQKNDIHINVYNRHEEFFKELHEGVDIVLMDVNMPNFNVKKGIQQIKAVKSSIHIILMTISTDLPYAISLLNNKAIYAFVQKDITQPGTNVIISKDSDTYMNCFEAACLYLKRAQKDIIEYRAAKLLLSHYEC